MIAGADLPISGKWDFDLYMYAYTKRVLERVCGKYRITEREREAVIPFVWKKIDRFVDLPTGFGIRAIAVYPAHLFTCVGTL